MAKQIEGVYEKVLECAKQEFLEKGFRDASLRTIATIAGTSTGSIYTRFHDKEGLFRELVNPVAQGMKQKFLDSQIKFHEFEDKEQQRKLEDYSLTELLKLLDYIYESFDEFKLLLDASYGTEFANFLNELVQIEVDYTYKYMEAIGCKTIETGEVTEEMLHIITTAYLNGVFEVVRHEMKKEEAEKYTRMLYQYHKKGFEVLLTTRITKEC